MRTVISLVNPLKSFDLGTSHSSHTLPFFQKLSLESINHLFAMRRKTQTQLFSLMDSYFSAAFLKT